MRHSWRAAIHGRVKDKGMMDAALKRRSSTVRPRPEVILRGHANTLALIKIRDSEHCGQSVQ